MHKLLERQLKRYWGEKDLIPETWKAFLDAVSQAYEQADEDRLMIERSFELASDEMIHMNETLKKQFEDRKKMEEVMHRSEKMSAVGQLASGVAHEINNPLGVILGFAQAVMRRLPSQDPMELPLKYIEKEALRCKALAQDLLTFSRTSKLEREPIDLNLAVEGALSLIRAKAKTTQGTVETRLAKDIPLFFGNTNQIQQVIINLSTNALDAMKDKGTLTIITEPLQENPLSWVCLRVRDTGPGIPVDVLPHIFEPFYTTKPEGQGTGLGLALIQEILAKHSAAIDVHSQPGATEFMVKFPSLSVTEYTKNPVHPVVDEGSDTHGEKRTIVEKRAA